MMILTWVLLAVLAATTLCSEKLSNHYVMKLESSVGGDLARAEEIAREHHFRVVGKLGLSAAPGYYVVRADHSRLRRRALADDATVAEVLARAETSIGAHPAVESFQRERVLKRRKRDYVADVSVLLAQQQKRPWRRQVPPAVNGLGGLDPMWPEMWYLNRHSYNHDLPDMNVSGAWAHGYSGRGVSITFLDDGLEHDHPDIQQNYDPKASFDINEGDSDPMPRYDDTNENKHGTRCAGEVAAVANNSVCSVGVAYNSGIGGIRMLDGEVTDSVEARSLSYNRDHIAIYSASWGPDDNGEVVDGPGPLARMAFVEGATLGRGGLGSIFVWASGNGGRFNDSCSCDGYANNIYTMSISSTSEHNEKPWYLEECTSTLATTYSSGDERVNEREIVTTDLRHQCTAKHTGTSAAAPLAAGIIALALEANPKLTWRDIMYLTVLTSRPKAIKSNNYIINKRGFLVSSRYGFGLMDAGRMVEMAKDWHSVPPMQSCQVLNSNFKINKAQKTNIIEAILNTDACSNSANEVNFIEQVEVIVSVQAPVRGLIQIYLTSPMGTTSILLPKRPKDLSPDGFKQWSFMSVQLWGEFPRGDWKLLVSSTDGSTVQLDDFSIIIHGTKEKPIEYESLMNMQSVNATEELSAYEASVVIEEGQRRIESELDNTGLIMSKLKSAVARFQSIFNPST